MEARMLYVHALSPIHVGIGQGAGVIDLPVIREAITAWPYLPGSSIKGVLRDACAAAGVMAPMLKEVFGPDLRNTDENPSEHAGGAIFTDLRLLCLPVRSYAGSFAWVSSPLALSRWARDSAAAGNPVSTDVDPAEDGQIVVPIVETTKIKTSVTEVRLEDLKLTLRNHATALSVAAAIARACFPGDDDWQDFFQTHFGIVSDTTFSFLTRTATEVTARNKIDDQRKVVADGALWWEEAVPTESIFAGQLISTRLGIDRMTKVGSDIVTEVGKGIARPVQIGGNATVGRGLALVHLGP